MEGVFDDDDDMLIQASGTIEEGDDNVDDADLIDLGAIKKKMMPLIVGDEESKGFISLSFFLFIFGLEREGGGGVK